MRRFGQLIVLLAALAVFPGVYSCQTPTTVPASTDGAVTFAKHRASVTWHASLSTGVYYRVYRSETSGGPYAVIGDNISQTRYTDNNVVSKHTYYYVITAVYRATQVESKFSPEAFGTIP